MKPAMRTLQIMGKHGINQSFYTASAESSQFVVLDGLLFVAIYGRWETLG